MTALRPLAAFLVFVTVSLAWGAARATPIEALSAQDAAAYRTAFTAAERGDFATSESALRQVRDQSLAGEVRFLRLMHPTAYTARYEELASWLRVYSDRPGAERVYALALRRGSGDDLPRPLLMVDDTGAVGPVTPSGSRGRAAREAYYDGHISRALELARASGDRWIAGLASYRLGNHVQAAAYFASVARNPAEDPWLRAGAGFWAARASEAAGRTDEAASHLRTAANFPLTFYGMLAARRLELTDDPLAHIVQASLALASEPAEANARLDPAALVRSDPRARRAAALMQIGRVQDAALELRAGMALAQDDIVRAQWSGLAMALNPRGLPTPTVAPQNFEGYPVPNLAPNGGFVIDRALVYGIIRQESRFNALATSPAGARGLMQLMPATAAQTSGMAFLVRDATTLYDPSTNLQIGQAYLNNLLQGEMGFDILRALAGYNGGPAMVARTLQRVGPDADSLLIIESLPFQESRNYVERVMANYWIYRRQFGQASPTLDALATGSRFADIRLDRLTPAQDAQVAQAIAARQVVHPSSSAPNTVQHTAAVVTPNQPPPGSLIQRPLYQQALGAAAPSRQGEGNAFR